MFTICQPNSLRLTQGECDTMIGAGVPFSKKHRMMQELLFSLWLYSVLVLWHGCLVAQSMAKGETEEIKSESEEAKSVEVGDATFGMQTQETKVDPAKSKGMEIPVPYDDKTLPELLKAQGFKPPEGFMALVCEVAPPERGTKTIPKKRYAFVRRCFGYGNPFDHKDWWPASTVKIYAAVAALETLKKMGFSPKAKLTYEDKEKSVSRKVSDLVRLAITPSDNTAFDQLVEIVGFDPINEWLRQIGTGYSVLMRGYSARVIDPEHKVGTLRHSRRITVSEKNRTEVIPERWGKGSYDCPMHGNCTSLWDLADVMRRVMLWEYLGDEERFDLTEEQVELLRSALKAPKPRGMNVVEGIKRAFAPYKRAVRCFHKPGFALNWFSDNVFVFCPDCKTAPKRWLLVMAGRGGRSVLDEASFLVARLVATGTLFK